jgi:predicted RNA-binding protein (virulence factor B family)
MLEIGLFNQLRVTRTLTSGALLDGGSAGEIKLDSRHPAEHFKEGDELSAFIYLDGNGVLTATTQQPLAQVGQVAWLQIVEVNDVGAFADWGLPKDLFIPFGEQQQEIHAGQRVLVRVYLDNQQRIAGSTRIDRWISDDAGDLKVGEQVALIIADKTELGYKAVVNQSTWGLLYANELFRSVRKGQTIDGFVKAIRKDKKVDLSLEKPGYKQSKIDAVAETILARLREHDGHLLLNDKSPPEAIYAVFGVSKKVFKQALGLLYKQKRVILDARGITLT